MKALAIVLKIIIFAAAGVGFAACLVIAANWSTLIQTYEACVSEESTITAQRRFLIKFIEKDYKLLGREELFSAIMENNPQPQPVQESAGIKWDRFLFRFDRSNKFSGIEVDNPPPFGAKR